MSADTPRATPLARYVAILIGLALLVLAVICGREIWLRNSRSIHWDSWVEPIVMTIGDATYEPWMLPAGFLAIGLGALLVWSAFRPRHRTHRRIRAAAPVWMRPVDISRTLCAAARTVPGVATAAGRVSGDLRRSSSPATGRISPRSSTPPSPPWSPPSASTSPSRCANAPSSTRRNGDEPPDQLL